MSPAELQRTAQPYGNTPFLFYTGSNSAPRVNHVVASFTDVVGQVVVSGFGRGVARTLTPDSSLSLLWPADASEEFSLIADGTGRIEQSNDTELLVLTITSSVLHRPAPVDGESSC